MEQENQPPKNLKEPKETKAIIDNYSVIEILESIGYRRIKEGKITFFGKINNHIYREVDRADMIEDLKNEILSMEEDFFTKNRDEISNIHKKSRALFDITSLEFLKTETIERQRDTETESYFFYLNIAVKVTKNEVELIEYKNLNGYVSEGEILRRHFSL